MELSSLKDIVALLQGVRPDGEAPDTAPSELFSLGAEAETVVPAVVVPAVLPAAAMVVGALNFQDVGIAEGLAQDVVAQPPLLPAAPLLSSSEFTQDSVEEPIEAAEGEEVSVEDREAELPVVVPPLPPMIPPPTVAQMAFAALPSSEYILADSIDIKDISGVRSGAVPDATGLSLAAPPQPQAPQIPLADNLTAMPAEPVSLATQEPVAISAEPVPSATSTQGPVVRQAALAPPDFSILQRDVGPKLTAEKPQLAPASNRTETAPMESRSAETLPAESPPSAATPPAPAPQKDALSVEPSNEARTLSEPTKIPDAEGVTFAPATDQAKAPEPVEPLAIVATQVVSGGVSPREVASPKDAEPRNDEPVAEPEVPETEAPQGAITDAPKPVAQLPEPLAARDSAQPQISLDLPPSTAPKAAQPLFTPEVAQAASQQIAQALSTAPDRPVELVLSPEELGRVKLSMQTNDQTIVVSIQADRNDTLDLMRRHIETLARDFRDIGFSDISFNFSQNPQSSPQQTLSEQAFERNSEMSFVEPAATSQPLRILLAPQSGGGLDLRM